MAEKAETSKYPHLAFYLDRGLLQHYDRHYGLIGNDYTRIKEGILEGLRPSH